METDYNPNTAGMFTLAKHLYLSGWTNWKSRATRREYWLGGLGWGICMLPLSCAFFLSVDWGLLNDADSMSIFALYTPLSWGLHALILLIGFIPGIGSAVRRLHDIGRSGWWYPLLTVGSIIPLLGIIASITLLVFMCKDSQKEANKWGISPKYGTPVPPVPPAA